MKYFYNDNWQDRFDYGSTANLDIGKPRIWLLDAPENKYHYHKNTRFIGFTLAPNPQLLPASASTKHSSVLFWEGEEVYFENIVLNQYAPLWPTINKIHTAKNCTIPYGIEVDKVTGLVTIEGGSSGGISGATGCEKLIVKNHTHPYCNTSAKYEAWIGNKFDEPNHNMCMYPQPEGMHTYEIILQNNSYNAPKVIDAHVARCIPSNFTLKAGTNITTDGNYIYIADVEATQYLNKGLLPDMIIYRDNGSAFHKVDDVEYTADKKWKVITTAPAGSFSNGQKWVIERAGYIKDLGGNTSMQWGVPVLSGYDLRWKGNTGTNRGARVTVWNEKDFRFRTGGGFRSIILVGMIEKITVNVTKPYTGKSSNIVFYDRHGYDDANRLMNINLKEPGIRTLARGGKSSGSREGDYLNATKLNKVLMELSYNPNVSAQNSILPKFTITINWRPYENK